jgi:thioredoxin 2
MSVNGVSVNAVQCQVCGRKNRVPAASFGIPHCGNCGAPLPWITNADDATFAETVEESSIPVLVDLWAPWCGPCLTVSPTLEKLAGEMAGRVKLVKINVDEVPNLARRFAVQGVPTLVVMQGPHETARQTGAAPEHALRAWLEGALRSPGKTS